MNALVPLNADMDIFKLGDVFHKSGYFKDIRDASQAVVKILAGRELGFEPMMSLMGIHIIEGKPSLSANLLAACVKRSGRYDYRVKETTGEKCAIEFLQIGRPNTAGVSHQWDSLGISEFTIQDAQRAGVVRQGGGWSKYPKAMLFARALSQGVRTYCPDVTMGTPAYVPEELGAEVNEEGDVIGGTMAPAPKTAPVVSREPVEIGRKAATTVKIAGLEADAPAFNAAVDPEVMRVNPEKARQADKPPVAAASEVKGAPAATKPPESSSPLISEGQAINFARVFREALPKARQKDAETLRHQWLGENGFVDGDGNPTAKVMLQIDFYEARENAEAWAKKQ